MAKLKIAASSPMPNKVAPERLRPLGQMLGRTFMQYENDRRSAEQKWARNARQFLGIYDPEQDAMIAKDRSRAYPKLTRVKCVSMVSRLMNLLFPVSEKNWTLRASPVPDISEEDLAAVLQSLEMDPNKPIEDQMIENAIAEFAKERAANLEREIEDQLAEIGGNRQLDYVSMCRKVLMSGVVYGMGVLKGPFARTQQKRTWVRNMSGMLVPQTYEAILPQFDWLPIWDYYPDLSAKYLSQMDGQFQRVVLARHQVRELAGRPGFFSATIERYLRDHGTGNYKRRPHESEVRAMGVQSNVNDQDGRKYEIIIWDGYVPAKELRDAGVEIPGRFDEADSIEAVVWMLDSEVIKADINPWLMFDDGTKVSSYHQFVFEEDESSLLGNGLPNVVRDSQMGIANSTRMLMDNASAVCGPNLELNTDLLRLDQDLTSVMAYRTWYRTGTGAEAAYAAVKNIDIPAHIDNLQKVVTMFNQFADSETFVNPATGGDMSKGPSEPFRTAAGASMLRGDAALPFKDVVRSFDTFTQSVIGAMVAFNRQFNPKPSIKGDFQVVPRGATSLISKEVRGMLLDNLAQMLTPEEKRYLKMYEFAKERLVVRDVDINEVLCTPDEAKERDAAAAQSQQHQQDQTDQLIRAEVRKLLADAFKSMTQGDKNAANADSTTAKSFVDVMSQILQGSGLDDGTNDNGAGAGPAPADTADIPNE